MRGLTDEEREMLMRWDRREYQMTTRGDFGSPPSPGLPVERSLFARGLACWEVVRQNCHERAVPTDLGRLALRVDLAARRAGVVA